MTRTRQTVVQRAAGIVSDGRKRASPSVMEAFLAEYGLSADEGIGLMCLAEALLRVPDAETIDELIADKIEPSNWGAHLGHSTSSLVNAATWGLMITGRVLDDDPSRPPPPCAVLGETIRSAMDRAAGMETIAADPVAHVEDLGDAIPNPDIRRPAELFAPRKKERQRARVDPAADRRARGLARPHLELRRRQ